MSEEKSLSQIAYEKFYLTRGTVDDIFYEVASAVEKEVLARLKKSEFEPVAGQELSFVQVAQWVENRVAHKKVNDPDDPTTWEKGVAIFRRDAEDTAWILDVFVGYSLGSYYKYHSERGIYKYAKLATPEQIEAWKLINDDL